MTAEAGMRPARALRLGLFTLGGLLLLVAAIVSVFGGRLFVRTERAVMHFDGSIYGLQVGAPVVFRGVQLGTVQSIGVVHDPRQGGFAIPVVAELNRAMIRDLRGKRTDKDPALALPVLVARGLRAQLSMQSLLTGQLYINLDLLPGDDDEASGSAAAAAAAATAASAAQRAAEMAAENDGMVEIPTKPNRLQTLQAQLEGFDLAQVLRDLSAISAGTRQLLAGPRLGQTLDSVEQATASLQRLARTLERRIGPLAASAQAALDQGQRAAGQLGAAAQRGGVAAERVGEAAERISAAASRADHLLTPETPLLRSVQRAADELATSASLLREAAAGGGGGETLQQLDRTLVDVARAARAVRELAESLERQPDALLRGRPVTPPP